MDTLLASELLIAVTSLILGGGGERTAFCTFIEDLKVKAAGCGTGSGLFKDKS